MKFLLAVLTFFAVVPASQASIKIISETNKDLYWVLEPTLYTRNTTGVEVQGLRFVPYSIKEGKNVGRSLFFVNNLLEEALVSSRENELNRLVETYSNNIETLSESIVKLQQEMASYDSQIAEKKALADDPNTSPDAAEILRRQIEELQLKKSACEQKVLSYQYVLDLDQDHLAQTQQALLEVPAFVQAISEKMRSSTQYLVSTENEEFKFIFKQGIMRQLNKFHRITHNQETCLLVIDFNSVYWEEFTLDVQSATSQSIKEIGDKIKSELSGSFYSINEIGTFHYTITIKNSVSLEPYLDFDPSLYSEYPAHLGIQMRPSVYNNCPIIGSSQIKSNSVDLNYFPYVE